MYDECTIKVYITNISEDGIDESGLFVWFFNNLHDDFIRLFFENLKTFLALLFGSVLWMLFYVFFI